MSAVPELVIPLNLDPSEAIRKLQALKGASSDSLDTTKKKTKETSEEMSLLGKGVQDAGNYLKSFVGFQAGMQAIQTVTAAIGEEWARVNKNIEDSTKKFIDFRKGMVEYARIMGKPLNNALVQETLGQAKTAGVDPHEYVKLQQASLGQFGGQIGKNITQDDFDKLVAKSASYMQASGSSAEDTAKGIGLHVRAAKKGTSVDNIFDEFGRGFEIAEAATGDTTGLLPEITQAAASGYGMKNAYVTSRVMAENGVLRQTSTYNDALARMTRQLHTTGDKDKATGKITKSTASKLGVSLDMQPDEMADQVVKFAKSQNVDVNDSTRFGVWLKNEAGIDDGMMQKAMSVWNDKGINGGLAASAREKFGTVGDGSNRGLKLINDTISNFEKEDVGQQAIEANKLESSKLEKGNKYAGLDQYYSRGERILTDKEEDKSTSFKDVIQNVINSSVGWGAYGTADQMQSRAYARQEIYKDADRMGLLSPEEKEAGKVTGAKSINEDREEMYAIWQKIEKHLAEANQQRAGQGNKPLQPKPAIGDTRLP